MEKRDLPSISRVHVHSAVVSRSGRGPAALVSVQPTSTSGHFALVYLADLLSPVLGDEVYGYRAKMIMGVMTRVGHERAPHVPKEARLSIKNFGFLGKMRLHSCHETRISRISVTQFYYLEV